MSPVILRIEVDPVLEVATTELLAVAVDFAVDLVFAGAFVASGEAVGLAEMALNDVALVAIGTKERTPTVPITVPDRISSGRFFMRQTLPARPGRARRQDCAPSGN